MVDRDPAIAHQQSRLPGRSSTWPMKRMVTCRRSERPTYAGPRREAGRPGAQVSTRSMAAAATPVESSTATNSRITGACGEPCRAPPARPETSPDRARRENGTSATRVADSVEAAIATVPTGLSADPPPGPAIPVTPTPTSTPARVANAFGHCDRHRLAHCAVLRDERRRDVRADSSSRRWSRRRLPATHIS